MRLLAFYPGATLPITQHGSLSAAFVPLARGLAGASVVCITLEPNGVLGRHTATGDQLFMVIDGGGWVSGDYGTLNTDLLTTPH